MELSSSESKEVPDSLQKPSSARASSQNYCVIQWETAAFYTYDAELNGQPVPFGDPQPSATKMSIGIARLGYSEGTSRVQWQTFDMSAKAGKHYRTVPPTWIEFSPGETIKDVTVEVIPSPSFDGTVEFGLYIIESSVVGAQVGKYLHTATVKIIDTSCYPDDAVRDQCLGGNASKVMTVEPARLVWYFLKCAWGLSVTRAGTKKMILSLQYNSLVAVLNIFLLQLVVATLTDTTSTEAEKQSLLFVYMVLWIIPFAGTHYLMYRQQFWKVGGSLRKHLQVLLLKKFLNYTDDSRSKVDMDELIMGLVRDVSTAVSDGYIATAQMVFGALFKVFYLMCTLIALQVMKGSGINFMPLVAVSFLPIAIVIFLQARQKTSFSLRQNQFLKEDSSIQHVLKTVSNYQLVADFDRRTFMLQTYETKIDEFNAATTKYNSNSVNSLFFAPWLTTLLVGVYLLYGGSQVVKGETDLATFLSTVSIFRSLGGEFEKAYSMSLKVTAAYASIAQLTIYLNLPVDVPLRLGMTRARRKLGRELRAEERKRMELGEVSSSPDEVPVDRLPIRMANIQFKYGAAKEEEEAEDANKAEASAQDSQLQNSGSFSHLSKPTKSGDKDGDVGSVKADGPAGSEAPATTEAIPTLTAQEKSERARKRFRMIRESLNLTVDEDDRKRQLVAESGNLDGVELELQQGKVVAIVGAPSQGKATILRLMAGQIFPDMGSISSAGAKNGDIEQGANSGKAERKVRRSSLRKPGEVEKTAQLFVPPHLRVVQIQENPMVLGPEESIFDNLVYGIKQSPSTDWVALEVRARKIMKRIGFNPILLEKHFTEKGYLGSNGVRITRGDRQLISLGRAFIMNPELIIAHKPTALLTDENTKKVLEMFVEFAEKRGVCMPEDEPIIWRRKRTIIFTARSEAVASKAHVVYQCIGGSLTQIPGAGIEGKNVSADEKLAKIHAAMFGSKGLFNIKKLRKAAGSSTDVPKGRAVGTNIDSATQIWTDSETQPSIRSALNSWLFTPTTPEV